MRAGGESASDLELLLCQASTAELSGQWSLSSQSVQSHLRAFLANSGRSVTITFQKCVPPVLALQMRKLSVVPLKGLTRNTRSFSDVPSALAEFWADMHAAHRAGLNEYWGACKSARYAQNLMPPSPLCSFAHRSGYEAATPSPLPARATDRPT